MNLLIVDDDLTSLKLLRTQLESEGHAVFEAHDGVDALALLEHQRMDAVISDILMPRMDGYRLCHVIRKHARLHDLPIILYTSTYTSPGDEKLALDVGANKFLKKPISIETLVAALHEAITMPHAAPQPKSLQEVEVLKEYSERLVNKLEKKNTELVASEGKKAAAEEALRRSHDELEARVKRRTAELARELARTEVLMEVASQSTRSLEPGELGERILEVARRLLGATHGSVHLVDPRTEATDRVAEFGFLQETSVASQDPGVVDDDPASRAIATGRVQISEAQTAPPSSSEPGAAGTESHREITFPAKAHGRTYGLVTLGFSAQSVFGEHEVSLYETIGDQLGIALENIRQFQAERRIADWLQEALLSMPRSVSGIEFAHTYRSSTEAARVGGDFYDLFELKEGRIGVSIGDVAGKGIDAAVLTSLAKHTIRAHAFEGGKTPAQVLSLTNQVIHEATRPESFVTIFFATIDLNDGRLICANAGHTAAALVHRDGTITSLAQTGPPAGAFEGVQFGLAEARLGFGELLFLYSDGLTEARRGDEFYGEERLLALLSKVRSDPQSVLREVLDDVMLFSGGDLRDDMAVLGLTRAEPHN